MTDQLDLEGLRHVRPWTGDDTFLDKRTRRTFLCRIWDNAKPRLIWAMLNPSKATAYTDDPTVRRCHGFSDQWGYGAFAVINLFDRISPDPGALRRSHVHAFDWITWKRAIAWAELHNGMLGWGGNEHGYVDFICAWGVHGAYKNRAKAALRFLECSGVKPHALKITKDGYPGHPLYLPGDTVPIPYGWE